MNLLSSFKRQPLEKPQLEYLLRVTRWGLEHGGGTGEPWRAFEPRLQAGKVSVAHRLHRDAEGIYNLLTGAILLSQSKLPLAPQTCSWALTHWDNPVVIQGVVDVSSVIVHETAHFLAAKQRGWLAGFEELGPYLLELEYLDHLEAHPDGTVRQASRQRILDLRRDAREQEGLNL